MTVVSCAVEPPMSDTYMDCMYSNQGIRANLSAQLGKNQVYMSGMSLLERKPKLPQPQEKVLGHSSELLSSIGFA